MLSRIALLFKGASRRKTRTLSSFDINILLNIVTHSKITTVLSRPSCSAVSKFSWSNYKLFTYAENFLLVTTSIRLYDFTITVSTVYQKIIRVHIITFIYYSYRADTPNSVFYSENCGIFYKYNLYWVFYEVRGCSIPRLWSAIQTRNQ